MKEIKVVKFPSSHKVALQKIICDMLEVKSIFELNDRFEGRKFYENYSNKVFGHLAVQKVLFDTMDITKIDHNKTFTGNLNINTHEINVVTTDFGEFPKIEIVNTAPVIFVFRKDELVYWVLGITPKNVLRDYIKKHILTDKDIRKKRISFHDLENVIPIENIEDVEDILNKSELDLI